MIAGRLEQGFARNLSICSEDRNRANADSRHGSERGNSFAFLEFTTESSQNLASVFSTLLPEFSASERANGASYCKCSFNIDNN